MAPPKEEPAESEDEEKRKEGDPLLGSGEMAGGKESGGDIRFIDTRRGRKALIYNGYIYNLSSTTKQSTYYWKCSQRSTGCTSTLILKGYDKKKCTYTSFAVGSKGHRHLPSEIRLKKQEWEEGKLQERVPAVDVNSPEFKNSNHLCLFCLSVLPPGYQDAATWEMVLPSGDVLSLALNDATKNQRAFEVLCVQLNVKWRRKFDGVNFDTRQCLPLCYRCQRIYQELWQVHKQIRDLEKLLNEQTKLIRDIIIDTNTAGRNGKLLEGEEKKTQLWMLGLHVLRKKVLDPAFNIRGRDDDVYQGKPEQDVSPETQDKSGAPVAGPNPELSSMFIKQEVDVVSKALNKCLNDDVEKDEGDWMEDDGAKDGSIEIVPQPVASTRRSLRRAKQKFNLKESDDLHYSSDEENEGDNSLTKKKSKVTLTSSKSSYQPISTGNPHPRRSRGHPSTKVSSRQIKSLRCKRYNKVNICHLCDARVIGGKAFLQHYTTVHPEERRYTCKFCQKHFTHPSSVLTHQRNRHTGEKPFQCQHCPSSFANDTLLASHTKLRHVDHSKDVSLFPCPDCQLTFHSKTILNNHLIATHGHKPKPVMNLRSGKLAKTLTCHLCNVQVIGQGPFLQHYRESHPDEKRFTCKYCKRHFPYIREVHTHQRRHIGEKPSQCTQCEKNFIDERSLHNHDVYHHGDKNQKFVCPLCPRVYANKVKLSTHVYSHKELIVICKSCGKTFRSAKTFERHNTRDHEGTANCTKPVSSDQSVNPETLKKLGVEEVQCRRKCHVCWAPIPGRMFLQKHFKDCHPNHPGDINTCRCGQQFPSYKKVYNHALSHHADDSNKQFQCDQCPMRFLYMQKLRRHQRTHIPAEERRKEYTCPKCGKGLTGPDSYQKHLERHEDNVRTRHVCEECGKDYAEKKGLQAHMKLEHLKIKPHKCPFEGCGKSFPLLSILLKHQNIHTGEKKYGCEVCGKNFHYSGSLKRHLREVHNSRGEEGQTPRKKKGKSRTGERKACKREVAGLGEAINQQMTEYSSLMADYPQATYGTQYPIGQFGVGVRSYEGISEQGIAGIDKETESPGGSSGY